MAVTIIATAIDTAGQKPVVLGNCKAEIVRLSGASVANTDTGTYTPVGKVKLNAAGTPVIIGLPHAVTASISNGVITFTNSTGGTLTALALQILIFLEK